MNFQLISKKLINGMLVACIFVFGGFGTTAAMAASFVYSGPPVAIPDGVGEGGGGGRVGAGILVSGMVQPVASVTMSIDGTECSATVQGDGPPTFDPTKVGIDHTYVSDLVLTLKSPIGTEVIVVSRTGEDGQNFCQVSLSDASVGRSIQTALATDAPFTGSWKPNAPLSAFAGESANGSWILFAEDFSANDTGSIRAWTINITPAAPAVPAPSVAPVPTLSEWAMITVVMLIGGIGMYQLRRRQF